MPTNPPATSVCEQYQRWAMEAVNEWDGQDTLDLFYAILEKTGEADIEVTRVEIREVDHG